jgi:hypothetical protein
MEVFRFIADNAFATIISGLAVALMGVLGNMVKKYKNMDKNVKNELTDINEKINIQFTEIENKINSRFDIIVDALLSISHDRLYQACMFYITTNQITVEELSNLEYLFKGYTSLGGNGTGEELYKKCTDLPVVEARTKYLNDKSI